MSDYAQELAEHAGNLQEQGKQGVADEVMHLATLAGYKDEEDQEREGVIGEHGGQVMADVEEEEVAWLWKNWLPLGYVSFLVGPANGGKSTVWSDLAARITTDRPMPDGTYGLPGGVIIISLEENTASVVRPRLRKAGADLSRIIDLSRVKRPVVQIGDPPDSPFMLPDDLPVLEQAIKQVNATLVVIDPLMSAVNANVSTFRNQSARKIVTIFQDMAERLGISVLIVNHFIKGNGKNLLADMAGSKGFSDIARSVIALLPNPSNAKQRTLSLAKHNLAPDGIPPITFQWTEKGTLEYVAGQIPSAQAHFQHEKVLATHERVAAILQASPTSAFTPTELAQKLDVPFATMRKELRRMVEQGRITQTMRGFYQWPTPPAQPQPTLGGIAHHTPPVAEPEAVVPEEVATPLPVLIQE